MRRVCVTGGAGFIGSNLVDRLSADGVEVVVLDNFRTGRREFVADALRRPQVRLVEGDVLDAAALADALEGCDWVFHLQANADVREGFEHPRCDLEQNTLATAGVLEAMRARDVRRIAFTSTGSIYGEPEVFPTPEDASFPIQTSLYGASKAAGEGLIAAYAAGYGFTGVICRLVSILGERYTHGHLFDFYRALRRDPNRLRVLGDGRQEKSYLYVQDCLDALLCAVDVTARSPARTSTTWAWRKRSRSRTRSACSASTWRSPRASSAPADRAGGSVTAPASTSTRLASAASAGCPQTDDRAGGEAHPGVVRRERVRLERGGRARGGRARAAELGAGGLPVVPAGKTRSMRKARATWR